MNEIRIKVSALADTLPITMFLGLSSVAIVLPFFIHLQWVTGPIINAIFIILLFRSGIRSALTLCLVPSLMALSGGLLPAILAPIVPFIMVSNVIFILTIDWFNQNLQEINQRYWYGVILGATFKFAFLLASIKLITPLLIKQDLADKVAQIFSWPQFATAVTGGMIAWIILRWLKRI